MKTFFIPIVLCSLFLEFSATARAQTNVFPSSGSVGIGTTTPQQMLEIAASAGNNAWEILRRPSNSQLAFLQFCTGTTSDWGVGTINDGTSDFHIYNYATAKNALTITGANGNVGIGTTNPAAVLQVRGSFVPGWMQLGVQATSADDRAGFIFWSSGGTRLASFYADANNNSYLSGTETAGSVFHIYTAGTEPMTFLPSGNVGIGTTDPAYKLSVNGTIHAKEVIVDTGWSDYVFGPHYHLQSLDQVSSYIKTHWHLPGIPTSIEVKADGVSIGQMQAKLLAQTKELILRLIAQDKHLRQQDLRVREQGQHLHAQGRQIAALKCELSRLTNGS